VGEATGQLHRNLQGRDLREASVKGGGRVALIRGERPESGMLGAMVIGLLTLDLHFPGARSLKDKRQALRSLETRIRNRFNVSIAEVEHQDLWQRARVAVVTVNTDHGHLDSTLSSVTSEAENAREIQVLDAHTEILG